MARRKWNSIRHSRVWGRTDRGKVLAANARGDIRQELLKRAHDAEVGRDGV